MALKDEFLNYVEQTTQEETGYTCEDGFKVNDPTTADYVIGLLKRNREEQKNISDTAQKVIDSYTNKVQAFRDKKLSGLQYQEQIYVDQLSSYLQEHMPKNKKSIAFVNGTIGFRKQAPKVSYMDEQKVLDTLRKEHLADLISIKESLNKMVIKKNIELDVDGTPMIHGVRIPEIIVEEQGDAFPLK